jgi:hypothetical protein
MYKKTDICPLLVEGRYFKLHERGERESRHRISGKIHFFWDPPAEENLLFL